MRIYIDESGGFIPGSAPTKWCAIAALVIRDECAGELLDAYAAMRGAWSVEPEIKGSALSDEQVVATLKLLERYHSIAQISAFDAGNNPPARIAEFQASQGQSFVNGLTRQHNRATKEAMRSLQNEWLKLSPQLACQMWTLTSTVEDVIRHATTYMVQRWPAETGAFQWSLDRKDVVLTPYERLWQKVACPLLQTWSLAEPMITVREFDYSAMKRFEGTVPDYLTPFLPAAKRRQRSAFDVGLIMRESVSFDDSRESTGLQLADIVASTFTKAMNGKLPPEVWRLLGPLTIERPMLAPSVRLVALGRGPDIRITDYPSYVLRALQSRARKMFVA